MQRQHTGWLENYPREYYGKYERVSVSRDGGWYEVYELPRRVYAIAEPQQRQEVNAFLIPGGERALLLDTGMGIVPLRPLIEELYEGPVITVNSHAHFDHIGSNGDFEPIHAIDCEYARSIARRGLDARDMAEELKPECFQFGFPEGFKPEDFRLRPWEMIGIGDGHVFDLGGRMIRVIATGGHCADHLCLFDETNHILFTGDLAYHGALFANFNGELFGKSDLNEYVSQIQRLAEELPEDALCFGSHNDFILSPGQFKEIADAFGEVAQREASGGTGDRAGDPVEFDFEPGGRAPHIYEFGGFSIYV